ncbi:MAG: CvpA family protein [Oscillospiraceae bacterium]|nr:CvpA family protein [Oscillospiraceae bacterium]
MEQMERIIGAVSSYIDGKEAIIIFWAVILGLTLYGHERGLLRMLISVITLALTVIGVRMLTPLVLPAFDNNKLLAFIVLFGILFVLIRTVLGFMDLASRLPILHGLNQLAGAAAGCLEGLLLVWVLYLLAMVTSSQPFCQKVLGQVVQSPFLTAVVRHNPIIPALEKLMAAGIAQLPL